MPEGDRVWRERGLRSAVLAGDEQAWRAWYEESFAGLDAFVRWRCAGRRDWAEDIVQETWLVAVRRIRSFDPARGSFADWLRGIAANLVRQIALMGGDASSFVSAGVAQRLKAKAKPRK